LHLISDFHKHFPNSKLLLNVSKLRAILRKAGFFIFRTKRVLKGSKKYERLGNDLSKYRHLLRIGCLMGDNYQILFMDEVFFGMRAKPHVVTLYKGSEVEDFSDTQANSVIGAIVIVSSTETILMKLFRRSIDAADISVFMREASDVLRRKYGSKKICIITDNYSAHSLPTMYQHFATPDQKILIMKGAKYFWLGNFIEDTFGPMKNRFYKSRGNQDI
jgi:hypothetical protein